MSLEILPRYFRTKPLSNIGVPVGKFDTDDFLDTVIWLLEVAVRKLVDDILVEADILFDVRLLCCWLRYDCEFYDNQTNNIVLAYLFKRQSILNSIIQDS